MQTISKDTPLSANAPPQALDVERTVLGSMLIDQNALDTAMEILTDECFYATAHRTIFLCVREMVTHELSVDIVTLTEELRKRELLETVGSEAYLSELVEHTGLGIRIDEEHIPVDETVQGVCDILGMDPLMMANEGKMIVVVPGDKADVCLEAMTTVPGGAQSTVIGEVHDGTAKLTLRTLYGTTRIITMPMGNQLPRIC